MGLGLMGFLFIRVLEMPESVRYLLNGTSFINDENIQPVIGTLPVWPCFNDEAESLKKALALSV